MLDQKVNLVYAKGTLSPLGQSGFRLEGKTTKLFEHAILVEVSE